MLMPKIMPCTLQISRGRSFTVKKKIYIFPGELNKLLKDCSAVFALGFKGAVAKTENHTNRYSHPKHAICSPIVMSDPVVPFVVHVGS